VKEIIVTPEVIVHPHGGDCKIGIGIAREMEKRIVLEFEIRNSRW
jgi:hypothetical protein